MGYELRVGAAPRLRQLVESCPWMTHLRRLEEVAKPGAGPEFCVSFESLGRSAH